MILDKKLIRDLLSRASSNIAIVVLISMGISIFASFGFLEVNLRDSVALFYNDGQFADAFIELRSMPYSRAARIEEIEGIKKVQGRMVSDFKVDFEGAMPDVNLSISSYEKDNYNLNKYVLAEGSFPSPSSRQILLHEMFARENSLKIGDKIAINSSGTDIVFTVVGLGQNPEFSYLTKNPTDLYSDYKIYGSGLVSIEDMQVLSGNKYYNDLVFTMDEVASFPKIKESLENELKPNGLTSLYERKDQRSNKLLDNEISQAAAMSVVLPAVFISIATMIEFITIERMVASQRGQIGILKAFGYSDFQIISHFVKYSAILGILGSIVGVFLSIPLMNSLITMYQDVFNIPKLLRNIDPKYFISSFIIGTGFSIIAGYAGSRAIASLNPAIALKAKILKYKPSGNFMNSFLRFFTTTGKMSLRNSTRNMKRSLFILVGIMLTFALTSLTFIVTSITRDIIFDRYTYAEKYDAKINLSQPVRSDIALSEIRGRYPLELSQSLFEAPVTLSCKNLSKESVIIGTDNDLYTVVDNQNNKIPLKGHDFLISKRLANALGLKVGDTLYVDSIFSKKKEKIPVILTGTMEQHIGMMAYMNKESLNELLGTKNLATSIILKTDELMIEKIAKDYEESKIVASVDNKDKMKESIESSMKSFSYLTYVFAFLGIVMGFIVIYNSYIIGIGERQRELTSMLVLGFSKKEVSQVVSLEQWIISFLAMILGIPVCKLILIGVSAVVSNDMWTMPTKLKPYGFIIGFFCTCLSVYIAQISGFKKIDEFSIVEVLKERD